MLHASGSHPRSDYGSADMVRSSVSGKLLCIKEGKLILINVMIVMLQRTAHSVYGDVAVGPVLGTPAGRIGIDRRNPSLGVS
jgi:hypothetical protein